MKALEARPRLSWSDQDGIIRLWHELMEFPASSPQEALGHCLRTLAQRIGAVNATWVGAAREKTGSAVTHSILCLAGARTSA